MRMNVKEAEAKVRAGAAALQQGRPGEAAGLLAEVTDAGIANAQVWLLLAHARAQAGDSAGEEAALDSLLAADPHNLRALILKGDCRARAGERRAATSFYRRARQVAGAVGELPPDLAGEIARVERALADLERGYKAHLDSALAERGFGAADRSQRFQQSLDILAGEKEIFVQQPTAYYFPELPNIQFYEREQFEWAERVESATAAIRAELLTLMAERDSFRPYMVADPGRPRADFHGLLDNPQWSSLYLWENGKPVEENVARCPVAFEALSHAPLPHISVRAPVVMFSRLAPGARIPPHTGMLNARLICHLPLIVPPGCGFRVGNEVRQWEEGKLLIFDDTIEHEAWNESQEDRVVLIFDIWRPGLSEEERGAVAAMFEAVDAYRDE
jgi:hypothetical protein